MASKFGVVDYNSAVHTYANTIFSWESAKLQVAVGKAEDWNHPTLINDGDVYPIELRFSVTAADTRKSIKGMPVAMVSYHPTWLKQADAYPMRPGGPIPYCELVPGSSTETDADGFGHVQFRVRNPGMLTAELIVGQDGITLTAFIQPKR